MDLKDIEKVQRILINDIDKQLSEGNLSRALYLIDTFADLTQRVNNILTSDYIECFLYDISKKYLDHSTDISDCNKKTVLFFDQIGTTKCLGLQYLRGLAANGYEIIYLFVSNNLSVSISDDLLDEVKKICKAYYLFNVHQIFVNGEYVGNVIRRTIVSYMPSILIDQSNAFGAVGASVIYSLKNIKKYKIVPGDHHFYIGTTCFDYFFEFRPFGWSTAFYERHIQAEKLFYLPYYPIIDEFKQFQGFPIDVTRKVVLAAGGVSYKFEGSDVFYKHLRNILTIHDNVLFMFIGNPSKQLVDMKRDEAISGKIVFLGYRRDFVAVIKNIDILINSYPFSGGLFCQTAAYFNKAILAFSDMESYLGNRIEDLLGDKGLQRSITFTSDAEFYSEAHKLITDIEYRQLRGNEIHTSLQTKEYFEERLGDILNGEFPTIDSKRIKFADRKKRIERYLYIYTYKNSLILDILAKAYGLKIFVKFPFLVPDMKRLYKTFIKYVFLSKDKVRAIFHNIFIK